MKIIKLFKLGLIYILAGFALDLGGGLGLHLLGLTFIFLGALLGIVLSIGRIIRRRMEKTENYKSWKEWSDIQSKLAQARKKSTYADVVAYKRDSKGNIKFSTKKK